MKKALILCFSNLKTDARVTRQINFVRDHYEVTAFCFDAYSEKNGVDIYKVTPTKLTLIRKMACSIFLVLGINDIAYRILYNYNKYVAGLRKKKFDLIIANDVETLPLAFSISRSESKIFLDAHEYAPRQFEDRLYWRIFFRRFNVSLCKKYIPLVDGMSTINNGLATAYETNFGIKPVVITNAADYFDLEAKPINEQCIKLVHHGIFNLSRTPQLMIELLEFLDGRFKLDLIYMMPENSSSKTKAYFEDFKTRALRTGRIRILPALKTTEIIKSLNKQYDIGIILVPPVNFNYENGLPNKLFDCIQARMAMAVGPLKEIAGVVNKYGIGVVSKDFTAQGLAKELNKITAGDLIKFKSNTQRAAEEMNSNVNQKTFLQALQRLWQL